MSAEKEEAVTLTLKPCVVCSQPFKPDDKVAWFEHTTTGERVLAHYHCRRRHAAGPYRAVK